MPAVSMILTHDIAINLFPVLFLDDTKIYILCFNEYLFHNKATSITKYLFTLNSPSAFDFFNSPVSELEFFPCLKWTEYVPKLGQLTK